jgi:alkyl sulfatase BDS1-like metallo-beta-lactamase superfamily hydrolase
LKLNAIRTDKPQVVIDAGSQKVHVYYPKGKTKSVDASAENVKSDLHDFIAERGAHIYEALPNHWNAVQVAKE